MDQYNYLSNLACDSRYMISFFFRSFFFFYVFCSVPASTRCGVCFTATSVESNTGAIEFAAAGAATGGHSAPAGSTARSDAALIAEQFKYAATLSFAVD